MTVAPDAAPGLLTHRQTLIVVGGLLAGVLLASLDGSAVGTALPRVVSELGGLSHLSWVVTVYFLALTTSTPLWGKISDLYGRRLMFQAAICVFVVGSVVAGVAPNIAVLIGGRAVQGLGAGGLIALAFSIVGDIVPARERGRYHGHFGALFGASSIAGPLLGGWFTDGPGWRWIFLINVPIGVAAIVVTSRALRRAPSVRRDHKVDYLGAALIVAAVSSVLLYMVWAGGAFGYGDPFSLGLLAAGVVLTGLLVLTESRAEEPIVPLRLFGNRVFTATVVFKMLMGLALFGGIIYLPVYFQVVQGMTPTQSGLALVPMMAGFVMTSIGSGQLMTRTGRYKAFPITGAAMTAVAIALLSTLDMDTPYWQVGLYVFVLGFGLGCTSQIVITIVQNAVEGRDLGLATSSVTFFQSMGGVFGTAIFGAALSGRLGHHLAEASAGAGLPTGADQAQIANNVQAIQALPDVAHNVVVGAWVNALQEAFYVALPFVVIAFALAWFIPELRLKTAADHAPPPWGLVSPTDFPPVPADLSGQPIARPAIRVTGLSKHYGSIEAVRNVSFDVQPGEVFAFLGPNGAGKSTTIKMLCTLARPTSGTAQVAGFDTVSQPRAVRRRIGLVFQDQTLDEQLTAEENLSLHAVLYRVPKREIETRIDRVLDLVGLADRRRDLVSTYSGGMARRLEIARALLHTPDVLFLDEPTVGLDPQTRLRMWNDVLRLRDEQQLTVFVTTHYLDEVEYADRVAIMDHGSIIVTGTPASLRSMIGHDTVELVTANNIAAHQSLLQAGYDVRVTPDRLRVSVSSGETAVARLIYQASVEVQQVRVRQPSLDDVFMHFTGREIREQSVDSHAATRRLLAARRR